MTDELVKHMTGLIAAGLDCIEQLTAERDASNELGKAHEEDAGQLRAERDRLREALGAFVAHYPKGINPDLDAACFAARAALKGESHE